MLLVFFFQAEDGIRGFHVTGVQTCALPISNSRARRLAASATAPCTPSSTSPGVGTRFAIGRVCTRQRRSEERRVGKHRRTGGSSRYQRESKNTFSVYVLMQDVRC